MKEGCDPLVACAGTQGAPPGPEHHPPPPPAGRLRTPARGQPGVHATGAPGPCACRAEAAAAAMHKPACACPYAGASTSTLHVGRPASRAPGPAASRKGSSRGAVNAAPATPRWSGALCEEDTPGTHPRSPRPPPPQPPASRAVWLPCYCPQLGTAGVAAEARALPGGAPCSCHAVLPPCGPAPAARPATAAAHAPWRPGPAQLEQCVSHPTSSSRLAPWIPAGTVS